MQKRDARIHVQLDVDL